MSQIIRVADRFVNIRGSFKIGPADIGAQTSLVQRANGNWLMLDSLKMSDSVKAEVDALTDKGKKLEAILNLHPFHTVSCGWAHESYPDAALYGTKRHQVQAPQLPWQSGLIEDPIVQEQFAEDLDLRTPEGVHLIKGMSENEPVHFGSVVAMHLASKTIHVSDTFVFIPTPKIAEIFSIKEGTVQLHPTLPAALLEKAGASEEFRAWMRKLISDWAGAQNLCAAHSGILLAKDNTGGSIAERLNDALKSAEPVLSGHELIHGKGSA